MCECLDDRLAKMLVDLTTKLAVAASIPVTGKCLYGEYECLCFSLGCLAIFSPDLCVYVCLYYPLCSTHSTSLQVVAATSVTC